MATTYTYTEDKQNTRRHWKPLGWRDPRYPKKRTDQLHLKSL